MSIAGIPTQRRARTVGIFPHFAMESQHLENLDMRIRSLFSSEQNFIARACHAVALRAARALPQGGLSSASNLGRGYKLNGVF